MELVCEKHREIMESAVAYCRHPREYCKFRTACLIHFLYKENRPPDPSDPESGGEDAKE